MNLKDKIEKMPQLPGIYIFKDNYNNIIYVGKSINLRQRVKSYFRSNLNRSRKIERMVKFIHDIEYIVTDTEFDALLLECEYIHDKRPMYNTLMNNYEKYKYIKLDKNSLNLIDIVNEKEKNGVYFGPFSMNKRLFFLRDFLLDYFKLPTCNTEQKCIRYNIGKCLGTCRVNTNEEYEKIYDLLIDTLKGEENFIKSLEEEMIRESSCLNFERAMEIKSNLELLKSIRYKESVINELNENKKILAWIKIDENSFKYYLVNNAQVNFSQRVDLNNFDKEVESDILNKIEDFKLQNNDNKIYDKSYIDYINIIYSYIYKNKDINYIYI